MDPAITVTVPVSVMKDIVAIYVSVPIAPITVQDMEVAIAMELAHVKMNG